MANDPSRNPIHANLPTYTGPQTQTKARETVAVLTGVAENLVQYIDDNVRVHLPSESTIRGVYPHGTAYWTRTAIIETEKPDGSRISFFLKVTHSDAGRINLRGEFESMSAIYKATPDFCPMPIATGDYASDPYVHFFLCSFVDMTDEVPGIEKLPAKLAQLHMKGVCLNKRYGFHVPTSQGALVMPNTWRSSWEYFFSEMMQRLFHWEEEMHGHQEEMSSLSKAVIEKVIPRLLRPLETGGRHIQPCIVHGDLWDGNTSTHAVTGKPVIFDASSAYVHNEYELGAWNLPRHQIYKPYISAYQRHFPASEPKEDVEDRLILYRLRFNMTSSGCYLNNLRFRELALKDMRYLTEKYPNGYEGSESRKTEEPWKTEQLIA